MPINYQDYSRNWFTEIRPNILKRANNCCEFCGVQNYALYIGNPDTRQIQLPPPTNAHTDCRDYKSSRLFAKLLNDRVGLKVWKVVVITIAHLNHDTTNDSPTNLKALCQRCHLKHDMKRHLHNRRFK